MWTQNCLRRDSDLIFPQPHSQDTMDMASETKRLEANQSELRLHQQTLQTSVIAKRERVNALRDAVRECKALLKDKEERARLQH